MPFDRQWMIGFVDETGRLVAMASILSDFLAECVWHIGRFIVATPLGDATLGEYLRLVERDRPDSTLP